MNGGGAPLTAQHVAVALIAACGVTGLKPETVFVRSSGSARTRMIAGGGLIARLNADRATVARLLSLPPTKFAPSQLAASRVTTDDMMVVADALQEAGLTEGIARGRAIAPATTAGADVVEASKIARPAKAPVAAPARREGKGWMPTGHAYRRARAPQASARAERLKPVTERIARWAGQQRELGADMDFVAWCFGVCPDALGEALNAKVAA